MSRHSRTAVGGSLLAVLVVATVVTVVALSQSAAHHSQKVQVSPSAGPTVPTPGATTSIPVASPPSSRPGNTIPPPATTLTQAGGVCPAGSPPSSTLSVTVTKAHGFDNHCYYARSGNINVAFTDDYVNPSSGLAAPTALILSPTTDSKVSEVGNSRSGLYSINPSQVLYKSPTANDTTSISFIFPTVQPGEYQLAADALLAVTPAILVVG